MRTGRLHLLLLFFPLSFLLINFINLAVGAQQEFERCVLIDCHVTKIIGQWGRDGSCDSFSSLNKVFPSISALRHDADVWEGERHTRRERERESSFKKF